MIIIIVYFIIGGALKEVKSKIASCPLKNSSIKLVFSYLYPIAITFTIIFSYLYPIAIAFTIILFYFLVKI